LSFFSRFGININFLKKDPSLWNTDKDYLHGKKNVFSLNVVNDTAERAVKLMEDYHGRLTKDDEKSELLLRCVQKHRRLHPNCNKKTIKQKF